MHRNHIPSILFTSTIKAPFVQDDFEFISQHWKVHPVFGSGIIHAIKLSIKCFKSDIAFCWFASTYSAIVVAMMNLLRRRSIIVVGGVDVSKEKEIGYGIWLTPWKAIFIRYALRHASIILPVDASLANDAMKLAGYDGKNIIVVPTGYDAHFWVAQGQKKRMVLTVAPSKREYSIEEKRN